MYLGDVSPIHLSGAGVLIVGLSTIALGFFLIARLPQKDLTLEDTTWSDRSFGITLDRQDIASYMRFRRHAAAWGFVAFGFIVVLTGLFAIYLHL